MDFLTPIIIAIVSLSLAIFLFKWKVRKIEKFNYVVFIYLIFCFIFGCAMGNIIGKLTINTIPDGFTTEATCTEYVATHLDELSYKYSIDTCTMKYWDNITIKNYTDSIYILFWGDRDSWMWRHRLDKGYWIYKTTPDTYDGSAKTYVYELAIFKELNTLTN